MSKQAARFQFIVLPCLMEKVEVCVTLLPKWRVVSQMGTTESTSFSSSTFFTITGHRLELCWFFLKNDSFVEKPELVRAG